MATQEAFKHFIGVVHSPPVYPEYERFQELVNTYLESPPWNFENHYRHVGGLKKVGARNCWMLVCFVICCWYIAYVQCNCLVCFRIGLCLDTSWTLSNKTNTSYMYTAEFRVLWPEIVCFKSGPFQNGLYNNNIVYVKEKIIMLTF